MDSQFATAMGRALQQARAGDPGGATRTIRAVLGGKAAQAAPPALPGPPADGIEDAEVVEVSAPRRRTPAPTPQAAAAGLQGMLDRLGCMAPQGLPGMGQGLGLGQTAAPPVPEGARYETRHFAGPEGARDYRLFIPSRAAPAGLVLMLHGCTQTPDDFASGTAMNTHAERHGLIVVYPHQPRSHNAMGCWNWFRPEDQQAGSGEAALLAALTRTVADEFGVPHDAIFAAGLSAGGAMVATLAATQPGLFAAVGVHSGLPHGVAHDLMSATAAMRGQGGRAVPGGAARTIIFHGTADSTVHPSNAEALAAAARPAQRGKTRADHGRSAGGRAWTRSTVEAPDGTPQLESWSVEGAGHAWFGGRPEGSYTDPAGPDASAEMIRFFLQGR